MQTRFVTAYLTVIKLRMRCRVLDRAARKGNTSVLKEDVSMKQVCVMG